MKVRRVVTGHTPDGKSTVVSDSEVDAITVSSLPGAEFLGATMAGLHQERRQVITSCGALGYSHSIWRHDENARMERTSTHDVLGSRIRAHRVSQ
jgi:hypothetical protein